MEEHVPAHTRHLISTQRGQISLMLAMMVTTFLFLMGFALGTGVLVNAKINLQNAADLAAYAGASVQARQLNQISYLNYEMRRQFKKFLFRYYVAGNYIQKSFPKPGETGLHDWSIEGTAMQVPAVCFAPDASSDNFCHLKKLAPLSIPPANILDPISSQNVQNLQAVEDLRQANCDTIGAVNQALLYTWLFNSDPALSKQQALGVDPKLQKILKSMGALTTGLGLVPRELLLRLRIETLMEFVNHPPVAAHTINEIKSLRDGPDPAPHEREIQAFMTAYNTLGNHIFDSSSIQLDEKLPTQGSQSNLLRLKEISVAGFDTYYILLEQGQANASGGRDCNSLLYPIILGGRLPLGFYKEPTIQTYYSIVLKANANLLFFGEVPMKAVAAAQPFGSRIGPELEIGRDLFATGVAPSNPDTIVGGLATKNFLSKNLPNLPIGAQDVSTTQGGWYNKKVLGAYYGLMQSLVGPTGNLDYASFENLFVSAMAPNPWEQGEYNIPNSFDDPFVVQFDSSDTLAFWAPVLPVEQLPRLNDILKQRVSDIMDLAGTGPSSSPKVQQVAANLKNYVINGLIQYVGTDMALGQGEDGEGRKIVRIKDPLVYHDSTGRRRTVALTDVIMQEKEKIKTSYNPEFSDPFLRNLRTGYSVKIVSFKQLRTTATGNSPVSLDPDFGVVDH